MTADKQTMYEILGVLPTASHAEIKAAHRRLSLEVMTGKLGLSREDCEFRLKLLDMALDTFSDQASRDAYDAKLASSPVPSNAAFPVRVASSPAEEVRALELVAAVEGKRTTALVGYDDRKLQLQAVSSTVSAAGRSLRTILRIIAGLLVLGFVLKMGQMAMASRHDGHRSKEIARAEEMLVIQQYYKKHGVRPASRAEAEFLEQENRRKENELRRVEFEKARQDSELRSFVQESREIGQRVHEDLVYAEEQARYEDKVKQRELQRQRDMYIEREEQRERAQRESQEQREWQERREAADE
jgi:hypothetical protein